MIGFDSGRSGARYQLRIVKQQDLVFISLTAGILVAVHQARIANRQRALAEQRFNDIRAVSHDLVFEIRDSIQYLARATAARKVVVLAALRYLNALSKDAPGSIPLQNEIATAYEKAGDAQGGTASANFGDTAGALESYNKALAIRQAVYVAAPSDPAVAEGLARSADAMGDALVLLSQWDESLKNYEASSATFKQLAASEPQLRTHKSNWALEKKKIGGVYEARQQFAHALEEYRSALAVDEELAKFSP